MSGRARFWGVLGIFSLLVIGALGGVVWQAMESVPVLGKEAGHWLQQQIALVMLVVFCLGGVLVHIWGWLDKVLFRPLASVSQAMEIMAHADPLHAITLENTNLLGSLPAVAHQLGEALFHARRQVREALSNSAAQIERLEKVIKHLHVGLIVVNADGIIILYNLAAQTLLRSRMDFIGLGRSLYDLLPRMPVETTMELLIHSKTSTDGIIQEGRRFFCAIVHDAAVLDCTMSLFPDEQASQIRFMITFDDVTRKLRTVRQSEQLRYALENLRGSVANLHSAAETRVHGTDRNAEICKRLTQVIDAEGKKLALGLDATAEGIRDLALEHWSLADVLTSDLLASLARQLAKGQGPTLLEIGEPLWIQADAPTLLSALTTMVQKIWERTQVTVIEAQTLLGNNRVYLDFIWLGVPIPADEVESWNRWVLTDGETKQHLAEILHRHVGEIWSQTHRRPGHAVLRLSVSPSLRQWPLLLQDIPERVEFYDFSLMETFASLGLKLARSLGGLTYVVFDTETTGLNPSKGDEIVSIAAVRIVNGRILSGETFERLINPQRSIPSASTRI
ncbi:MAG: exonuclease domain-containing protein, partial [Magnetococcus sp. XQGC-1]